MNTYKDWTAEDRKKVIFSDECVLCVGVDPHRQWVIRPKGQALEKRYLMPGLKSGHVSIMVWACFSGKRIGPILVLEQRGIGADEYERIVCDRVLPMADNLPTPPELSSDTICIANKSDLLFMHDNGPYRKTPNAIKLLEENNTPVMKWLPQSPDLNPIENLGRDLKHHFYLKFHELQSSPSASKEAFEAYSTIIHKCWYAQNQTVMEWLIESMPHCCKAVIEAKGGHTKY